jgi:hypothetical protein
MTLEFALVALQCGSRGGVREDVAYGLPPSELAYALYGGAGGLLQVLGMNSAVGSPTYVPPASPYPDDVQAPSSNYPSRAVSPVQAPSIAMPYILTSRSAKLLFVSC